MDRRWRELSHDSGYNGGEINSRKQRQPWRVGIALVVWMGNSNHTVRYAASASYKVLPWIVRRFMDDTCRRI
jgi:hypothetical protein